MAHEDEKNDRKFNINVDRRPFSWPRQFITGTEIKGLVTAPSEYGVWLVVPGPAEDKPIGDDEKVDLGQPGVERFITGPTKTTEGDGSAFLPERDRAYLLEKAIAFEEIQADGQRGVVIRGYTLPEGVFDTDKADVLIVLPPGYADAAPDMFYTLPWLKLKATNALPRAADQAHQFAGKSWQRWSRHNNEWRAGIDGIWTMLKRIAYALGIAG